MEFILAHKIEVLAVALAVSELLACIPKFKSNSILELIINGLKKIK
jgi:hypothetical protein